MRALRAHLVLVVVAITVALVWTQAFGATTGVTVSAGDTMNVHCAGPSQTVTQSGLDTVIVCAPIPTTTTAAPTTTVGSGVCPTTDSPSTYAGTKQSINTILAAGWNAGFRTENQLLAVTAIGIAESSLWSQARNWHPEYGCRPATNVIGVQGPASVWNTNHTRQLNSDRGVWQISSRWWPQYTDAQCDNVASAAGVVWQISAAGTNFQPWDTFKNGSAQAHYDASRNGWPALRPLVQSFLTSR